MMDGTEIVAVSMSEPQERFHWSDKTIQLIKSVFFIGYALLHIPGSFLGQKYGGKAVLNLGLFLSALCTLLTPMIWKYGKSKVKETSTIATTTMFSLNRIMFLKGSANGLIALRIFMGICEAATYPAVVYLLSRWIPRNERGRVSSIVFCGGQVQHPFFFN